MSGHDIANGGSMKLTGRIAVALALALIASAASADEFATRHVTVYGTASLEVAPDQMKWRLNVRNTDPTSTGAVEEHAGVVASVLAFLERSRIATATIQTSRMQLGENWTRGGGSPVRAGYFASTDVDFVLADFGMYSPTWIGLSALPGVTVRGVDMDHTDRIRFQNEARVKAVLAARDKAQAMAEALGARLGDPLIVDEDLSVSEGWRAEMGTTTNFSSPVGESAGVEESLAPGAIPIKARVRAVFELMPQR
jgi:uncharacterized protein